MHCEFLLFPNVLFTLFLLMFFILPLDGEELKEEIQTLRKEHTSLQSGITILFFDYTITKQISILKNYLKY